MFHNQEEIWRSIHGQKVDIPNLLQLFPTWTLKLHPEYARARDEVLNPWIRRWVDNERTCYKLQKAEFGIFAAILCADAPYDRFCTVAKYFTWYYLWDDIYDCGTLKGSSAFEMAQYREVSMQYIKHHLLPEHPQPDLSTYSAELQKALLCWEEVGSHIQSVCSQETREILCDEMLNYMQAVGDSNELFDGGKPPSLEAYWKRRDCAAGIYPGIATIPFVYGVDITRSDVSNPAMKKLWKHTSFAVHIANDMLSLRKELNDGQLENLVPVLALNKQLSMNEAMQQATTTPKRTRLAWKNLYTPCERAWGTRDSHWPKPSVKDAQTSLYSGQRYFKPHEIDAQGMVHFHISALEPPKQTSMERYRSHIPFAIVTSCLALFSTAVLLLQPWSKSYPTLR